MDDAVVGGHWFGQVRPFASSIACRFPAVNRAASGIRAMAHKRRASIVPMRRERCARALMWSVTLSGRDGVAFMVFSS